MAGPDVDETALAMVQLWASTISLDDVRRYVEGDGCEDLTDAEYENLLKDIHTRIQESDISLD